MYVSLTKHIVIRVCYTTTSKGSGAGKAIGLYTNDCDFDPRKRQIFE